jgi:adenine/guanine phosphoribosyltransferase-like PRPP-binding protein
VPDLRGSVSGPPAALPAGATYCATIGSQRAELPIVPLDGERAIALMMTIDLGVQFTTVAAAELARVLAPARPERVVSIATLGIPVAFEVSRCLGIDDYLILQKSPKVHLRDCLREPVESITSTGSQYLLLDRRRTGSVRGQRVAFVDDVISTGASALAALRLLRQAGADVVAIGALLAESSAWRTALGPDSALVRTLGTIPLFRPGPDGGWVPGWD